jgi:hypothetical protein
MDVSMLTLIKESHLLMAKVYSGNFIHVCSAHLLKNELHCVLANSIQA